ncbi:MAG: alpha/beta fold hydrolase [Ignavibacteria bacterium]
MHKKNLLLAAIIILKFNIISFCQIEKGMAYSNDSVKISYIEAGKGSPALVFVHGLNINKTYWSSQIEEFSKKYKVAALDLAGHGESGTRKDYSVQAYGEDVASVVNNLDLKEIILIGHSMGGAIIIDAARLLKGKVKGLIGVDTYHELRAGYPKEEIDEYIEGFKADFRKASENLVSEMFPQKADIAVVSKVENDFINARPEKVISTFEHLFAYDQAENVKDLRIPVISINTDLYPTNAEANKKIADFSVKIIKGIGHFPMLENKVMLNKYLAEAIIDLIAKE